MSWSGCASGASITAGLHERGRSYCRPDAQARSGWCRCRCATGAFIFSIYGLAVAQTHDRFPPTEALEATKGLLLLHGIGAAMGPLLCGAIMHLLLARGFPVALALATVSLAVFTAVRIRRDPPVVPANRTSFVAVEQSSPGATELPHLKAEDLERTAG